MERISNEEPERRFDEGEDITEFMDPSTVRRPNLERVARRISMDVPGELVRGLDKAASRMGVSRQSIIKIWLTERLDQEAERELMRARNAQALVCERPAGHTKVPSSFVSRRGERELLRAQALLAVVGCSNPAAA